VHTRYRCRNVILFHNGINTQKQAILLNPFFNSIIACYSYNTLVIFVFTFPYNNLRVLIFVYFFLDGWIWSVLPHITFGDWARHPVFLGCSHGYVWEEIDW